MASKKYKIVLSLGISCLLTAPLVHAEEENNSNSGINLKSDNADSGDLKAELARKEAELESLRKAAGISERKNAGSTEDLSKKSSYSAEEVEKMLNAERSKEHEKTKTELEAHLGEHLARFAVGNHEGKTTWREFFQFFIDTALGGYKGDDLVADLAHTFGREEKDIQGMANWATRAVDSPWFRVLCKIYSRDPDYMKDIIQDQTPKGHTSMINDFRKWFGWKVDVISRRILNKPISRVVPLHWMNAAQDAGISPERVHEITQKVLVESGKNIPMDTYSLEEFALEQAKTHTGWIYKNLKRAYQYFVGPVPAPVDIFQQQIKDRIAGEIQREIDLIERKRQEKESGIVHAAHEL